MGDVYCNNCGHRNPLGSNFCSSCGSVLETSLDEPTTITFHPITPSDPVDEELSFDLDDGATQDYQAYAAKLGPQLAQAMFFGDVFRSAPFDKASTVPDATGGAPFVGALGKAGEAAASKA